MKWATAAALLLAASSCAREAPPPATGAPMTQEGVTTILEGTQARVGPSLTIGAGNFWDENGQLTCALWVAPAQAGERVKKGQVLERDGRKIEVVDIRRDGGKGLVDVKVSPP